MGLQYYMEQVTSSIVHVVCRNDKGCEFNPLPGTLFYLLEQEEQHFFTQGRGQFFLMKVYEPVWNMIKVYKFLVKRVLNASCKSPLPSESKFSA